MRTRLFKTRTIKARQRVRLSPTNLLHQVRHLMAPQLRASSIDLVVEPIALRGQMPEVVILEVEDNGTGIPRGAREACGGGARNLPPCQWGLLRRESVCRPFIMLNRPWIKLCIALSRIGMFYDAAMVLEEIAPKDKNRTEVLGMGSALHGSQEMGHGGSGCQPSGEG
jgi:hypothetical protein